MSGVEVSDRQTIAGAPIADDHQQVWNGTRGNRHPALGTVVVGAVAMHTNPPVSIDETLVTALRAVERRLPRRGIVGSLSESQHGYIYRLQSENPRDSAFREGSITGPAQDGDS